MLASGLVRLGHKVTYIGSNSVPWNTASQTGVGSTPMDILRKSKHLKTVTNAYQYSHNGITCLISPSDQIEHLVSELPARNLVITSQEEAGSVLRAVSSDSHTVLWLHSTGQSGLDGLSAKPKTVIATSHYVRDFAISRSQHVDGVPFSVFYPPFDSPKTLAGSSSRDIDVLMVNPIPPKGVDIFFSLAKAMPELKFTAVEGWWDASRSPYFSSQNNLTYISKSKDPSRIFARSKILLVPSNAPEGFGRVAVEAALHGCVPIVSGSGGLKEAVPDIQYHVIGSDIEQWREKIQGMLGVDEKQRATITQKTSKQFLRDYATEFIDIVQSPYRNGL